MQVSLESLEGLHRKLTIELPWDGIEDKEKHRLSELQRTLKLDGFRPGKTPLSVVKKRYGKAVTDEIISQVMRETFSEAIEEKSLRLAGAPVIQATQVIRDKPFTYEASFEVIPEIELVELTGVTIDKPVADVTDEDVEETIENLRKHSCDWEEVDRAAQQDDQVIISFVGRMDGEEFPGGSAQEVPLELGSNKMIPGFEDAIIGLKASEEKVAKLTFPEDYGSQDLAGKAAEFTITLSKVSEAKLPPLDDDFAQKYGIETGGVDKLREEVRQGMERELNFNLKNKLKKLVFDKLLDINEVEIPTAMLDQEIQRSKEHMKQYMQRQFGSQFPVTDDNSEYESEARRRVGVSLLLSEVIQAHKISPDVAKVRAIIEQKATAYDNPDEIINWYYTHEEMLKDIQHQALEEQVIEKLLEKADIKEESLNYKDVMQK